MRRESKRDIPVLIGENYEHIMARANIVEEGDKVVMTITAQGGGVVELQQLLMTPEPMALAFVAIPVKPHTPKERTT